jgi:hypothetical protein
MEAKTNLFEIVSTTNQVRSLTHFLHGREQKSNEDGNNGDDYKELDQGKGPSGIGRLKH